MKGYKGFDKDLKCRDLQYEVGKEAAVDGDIELCKRGIHFCENPHDIFSYYAPGENNRFAVVEAEDVSDESNGNDSKRVCKRLTVKAEIASSSPPATTTTGRRSRGNWMEMSAAKVFSTTPLPERLG